MKTCFKTYLKTLLTYLETFLKTLLTYYKYNCTIIIQRKHILYGKNFVNVLTKFLPRFL